MKKSSELINELKDTLLARYEKQGYDSVSRAHATIGYMGGMLDTIMRHLNDDQRAAAIDDLVYHIKANKVD